MLIGTHYVIKTHLLQYLSSYRSTQARSNLRSRAQTRTHTHDVVYLRMRIDHVHNGMGVTWVTRARGGGISTASDGAEDLGRLVSQCRRSCYSSTCLCVNSHRQCSLNTGTGSEPCQERNRDKPHLIQNPMPYYPASKSRERLALLNSESQYYQKLLIIANKIYFRYARRHIAFRVAYLGWNYHGFAIQKTTPATIEVAINII